MKISFIAKRPEFKSCSTTYQLLRYSSSLTSCAFLHVQSEAASALEMAIWNGWDELHKAESLVYYFSSTSFPVSIVSIIEKQMYQE